MTPALRELTFRSGRIRVDSDARAVFADGAPVKLGGRAFDLLEALIARRDRVVPKQELMDLVWPGLVVEENNLQVHVTTLRKILGADSIVTVAGRGYRFALTPDGEGDAVGGRGRAAQAAKPAAQAPSSPATLLIGRETLTAAVTALLRRKDVRLVTLTGPGGAGKTRLGLQVTAELAHDFADGSYIVMLAPVRDPVHVPAAIADVLGIQESGGRPAEDLLIGYLSNREVLLTLDNFEHVLAASRLIAKLLDACPRLKVLVTSRAVLRLTAERDVAVPPLTVPDRRATAWQASTSAAVRLFVERALAAGRDVSSSDSDLGAAAEICRRLDGLPLAIELAAARLKVLSPQALLDRLDRPLQLLKSGQADLPERQKTLRGALAWGHELLSADEQALFRRLSVFVGGWSLEAAEAIAADGLAETALDVLEGLVDQSLVQRVDDVNGEPRFTMLETVREYAQEQLEGSGEETALRQRHAAYCLQLAERAEPYLTSAERKPWMALLQAEQNNLRAALVWLIRERADAESALRLAGALPWMWYFAGHYSEGRTWLSEALGLADGSEPIAVRAKALSGIARLATYAGDPAQAVELAGRSVELWRKTSDRRGLAFALLHLGIPSMIQQQASAREIFEESAACFRQAGDAWGTALAITYVGTILAMTPGKEAAARRALGEGHARFEALGDDWGGTATYYLGLIAQRQGNFDEARKYVEAMLLAARDAGDLFRVSRGLHQLAEISLLQQRPDEARRHLAESIGMTSQQGRVGDLAQQFRLLARIVAAEGRHERAARLFAAAAQLASQKSTLPPEDPRIGQQAPDEVRRALGERRFDSESAFGAAMTVDQVVRWILADEAAAAVG